MYYELTFGTPSVNRTGSTTDRQHTQSAGRISFSHRVSSASRERVADVGENSEAPFDLHDAIL